MSAPAAPPALVRRGAWAQLARKRRLLRYVWILLLIPVGVWWSYMVTERHGIDAVREAAAHRIDIYENTLASELARYDYLPRLLNLNPDTVRLLASPADAQLTGKVNHYLAAVNQDAHSNTLYIMDLRGNTLASSNWDQPLTFVGMNFAYRPYFIDALRRGSGVFYGLGTTSKEAGYFYAQRVYDGDKVVGIATVKISLDKIEALWKRSADTVLIADRNAVVFLATFEPWRFKSLTALSDQARATIAATRQYDAPGALEAIGLSEQEKFDSNAAIERFSGDLTRFSAMSSAGTVARPDVPPGLGRRFLAVSRPVSGTDWKIVTLSNIEPAEAAALNVATGTGLGLAFITVFILYVLQRRRIIAQELATKVTLRRLNDELERKVLRRTEALSRANKTLKGEVVERQNTEAALKATLQELVQAGKMAALGQMSASITHELNQPLAALRTLSDNALIFIQRDQVPLAQANLKIICELTERMGRITRELKRFARKTPALLGPVALGDALNSALFLLDSRLRRGDQPVRVQLHGTDAGLHGLAEATRLEQVLVNLIVNALDAMARSRQGVLAVTLEADGEHVAITVADNGAGLSEQALAHLFEPFFTTKDQGEGLGLGLTISLSIIREFGGTLSARNRPEGGAEFIIRLRAATPHEPDGT